MQEEWKQFLRQKKQQSIEDRFHEKVHSDNPRLNNLKYYQDVLYEIFNFLDLFELLHLRLVSKDFAEIVIKVFEKTKSLDTSKFNFRQAVSIFSK